MRNYEGIVTKKYTPKWQALISPKLAALQGENEMLKKGISAADEDIKDSVEKLLKFKEICLAGKCNTVSEAVQQAKQEERERIKNHLYEYFTEHEPGVLIRESYGIVWQALQDGKE